MSLSPGYGHTPSAYEALEQLTGEARATLGPEQISKAAVYDLEQAVQDEVAEQLLGQVVAGSLRLGYLLTDSFVRQLHRSLYGDIWRWAGVYRTLELNIGIAPEQIAAELRASVETLHYRWEHTSDWTGRQLGIAAHAETVRIHPFTDGNGRATRQAIGFEWVTPHTFRKTVGTLVDKETARRYGSKRSADNLSAIRVWSGGAVSMVPSVW